MKKISLLALVVAGAAVLMLTGCPSDNDDDGGSSDVNGVSVGDTLTGGFEVVVDDAAGGYVAVRSFDADDDGTVDEYQAIMRGRFLTDVTLDNTLWTGSTITDVPTATDDVVVYLEGSVFIGANEVSGTKTVLTITDGDTEVRGVKSSVNPGTLVIDRNGQIDAQGSSTDPIVFTSAEDVGEREPGDWGGMVINGSAVVQGGTAEGEGGTGTYGGTTEADDSGTLSYVRVEFGGTLFTPDNELNGIAFQGVGDGTTVEYVQVHKNADDGVEFFGGSVAAKYLVLTGIQDDAVDYDDGWNGSVQFVIIHQYGDGGNAIEADGDADTGGVVAADPVLANFTIIGAAGDNGPNFKSSADGDLWNSVILNYSGSNTTITENGAGDVTYRNVVIFADADTAQDPSADSDAATAGVQAYAEDWVAQVGTAANGLALAAPASIPGGLTISNTAPDFRPDTAGDTDLPVGSTATLPATDLAGNSITAAAYLGAIEAGGTDWTTGWTAYPEN